MTRENKKYVAKRKNQTTFNVKTRLHDHSDSSIVESVLKNFDVFSRTFDKILTIRGVNLNVRQYDSAVTDAEITDTLCEIEGMELPISVRGINGVTSSDISAKISEIDIEDKMAMYLSIKTTDMGVDVYLEDGFFTIDASTLDRYKFHRVIDDEYSERKHTSPAMKVSLGYRPVEVAYGYDEPVTRWKFDTPTDIWFEETRIGQINRARLHECFEQLDDELNILEYNFVEGTVGVGQDDIDALFEYDGSSSEFLIQQHRREWVEEKLRPTETQSTSGDTRVLTWTAPDSVPGDELKTRVEVYVEAQQSKFQDIDRICVSQEESSVCGEIVGQNVEWESDGE